MNTVITMGEKKYRVEVKRHIHTSTHTCRVSKVTWCFTPSQPYYGYMRAKYTHTNKQTKKTRRWVRGLGGRRMVREYLHRKDADKQSIIIFFILFIWRIRDKLRPMPKDGSI